MKNIWWNLFKWFWALAFSCIGALSGFSFGMFVLQLGRLWDTNYPFERIILYSKITGVVGFIIVFVIYIVMFIRENQQLPLSEE